MIMVAPFDFLIYELWYNQTLAQYSHRQKHILFITDYYKKYNIFSL